MPGLVCNEGRLRMADWSIDKRALPSTLSLRLFTNDITPNLGDALATYTEMTGQGYAAKSLNTASLTNALVGNAVEMSYAQQTWTFTGGTLTNIYGYYLVDTSDGKLIAAERFATPFPAQTNGDQIKVTLVMPWSGA